MYTEDNGGAAEEFFECFDFGGESCRGEEGLQSFGEGFGHAEKVGFVAVGEDEVGFVDDEVREVGGEGLV